MSIYVRYSPRANFRSACFIGSSGLCFFWYLNFIFRIVFQSRERSGKAGPTPLK